MHNSVEELYRNRSISFMPLQLQFSVQKRIIHRKMFHFQTTITISLQHSMVYISLRMKVAHESTGRTTRSRLSDFAP